MKRARKNRRAVQFNWWEQDLYDMCDLVIRACAMREVKVELVEWKKDGDASGFPVLTTFTLGALKLIAKLHHAGVKVSLDDCNWIKLNHPCNFDFALVAAPFLAQVKLDISARAQVYNMLPNAPYAFLFAPLETDLEARNKKEKAVAEFVTEIRRRNPNIGLVIELSVVTRDQAQKFPQFNVFRDRWVLVQGGRSNNWAEKA